MRILFSMGKRQDNGFVAIGFLGLLSLSGCATPQYGKYASVGESGPKICSPERPELQESHLPRVETLSLKEGGSTGGNLIKISGRGFKSGVQVLLGDQMCESLTVKNERALSCSTPPHDPGEVDLVVVNPDLSCAILPGGFRYVPKVTLIPNRVRISVGDQFQFQTDYGTEPIEYSLIEGLGKIDAQSGLYTTGEEAGTALIQVKDAKGSRDTAALQVRPRLEIKANVSQLTVGESTFVSATGGFGPYEFSIESGDGVLEPSTGRLTALSAAEKVPVTVRDFLHHEASVDLKFIAPPPPSPKPVCRVMLSGPEKVETGKTVSFQVKDAQNPYVFQVVSGSGAIDLNGQFTAPSTPGVTVVSVKDSNECTQVATVTTVPSMVVAPLRAEIHVNEQVRFTALGGFMPYSYTLVQGSGKVDPDSGVYTAPDEATVDQIQVKDANGTMILASVRVHAAQIQTRSISSALSHSCAIAHGAAKCWGDNSYGQLGDGTQAQRLQPVAVYGLEEKVASIAAGYRHSCALLVDGSVYCWGDNSKGQLGVQTVAEKPIQKSLVPRMVAGMNRGVVALVAGQYHTCAVRDGKVYCWGDNSKGQLGNDREAMSPVPTQVETIVDGAETVTAGTFHTCAIVKGGAKCWGSNFNGQLGNHSRLDSDEPVDVESLTSGVTAIESKGNHTCALAQGGLYCWGYNGAGQLGDPGFKNETAPVRVQGIEGAVEELSLGYQHTCVRLSQTPRVRCWGYSFFGQIGKERAAPQVQAHPVELPDTVTALGSGVNHTCALMGDYFSCWGRNSRGQLGNRTTKDQTSPTERTKLD